MKQNELPWWSSYWKLDSIVNIKKYKRLTCPYEVSIEGLMENKWLWRKSLWLNSVFDCRVAFWRSKKLRIYLETNEFLIISPCDDRTLTFFSSYRKLYLKMKFKIFYAKRTIKEHSRSVSASYFLLVSYLPFCKFFALFFQLIFFSVFLCHA